MSIQIETDRMAAYNQRAKRYIARFKRLRAIYPDAANNRLCCIIAQEENVSYMTIYNACVRNGVITKKQRTA